MGIFGGKSKRAAVIAKEEARSLKVSESQQALIEAAVSTANMAADVTRTMKKRMEDAMRQFESTTQIMNDGLLICDLKGQIQAFNPVAARMFGLTEQIAVTTLFDYEGDMLITADELWTIVKGKKRGLKGKHVDASLFPVKTSISVLDRSDGTTVVLLVVKDLTFVTKTFQQDPFAGFAVALASGEIVAANSGVHRLFGYSCEEILGKPASVIMSSKDMSGNHLNLQYEVARIIWDGEEAVLITMRELEPTKKPVSRPRRDNGVDMTCTYDTNFIVTSANQTFLKFYGLKKKDAIGTDIREHMPYSEVEDFTAAVRALSPDVPAHRTHFISESDDGMHVVHDWIDHAMFDFNGNLTEVQRTGRDIGQAVASALGRVNRP